MGLSWSVRKVRIDEILTEHRNLLSWAQEAGRECIGTPVEFVNELLIRYRLPITLAGVRKALERQRKYAA